MNPVRRLTLLDKTALIDANTIATTVMTKPRVVNVLSPVQAMYTPIAMGTKESRRAKENCFRRTIQLKTTVVPGTRDRITVKEGGIEYDLSKWIEMNLYHYFNSP